MGALKIDCYSSETQMSGLIKLASNHLYNKNEKEDGLPTDFDEVVDDVRLILRFDYKGSQMIVSQAEVLDSDWDLLESDTAVFKQRFMRIVKMYTDDNRGSAKQAYDILKDQLEYANY